MRPARLVQGVCLATVLLAATSAGATITPQARVVVDRFLAASGGRAALDRLRALHAKGTLQAFGLKGTIETWRAAPDRRASLVDIGPVTLRDGTTAGHAWRIDPSGKLLTLDGRDLETAQAGAWFENERWLEPDQGGGAITRLPDTKDSLGTFTVLEVTPPAGKPRQLEFDPGSGLLVRTIAKNDALTVITTFSDNRAVGGWKMAFTAAQTVVGAPANNATVTLDSVEVPATIADDRFAPPARVAAGVSWLKSAGVARIPFAYRRNHVWLRASVNGGPPADFVYDTGASITVLDSAYAARAGIRSAGSMAAQGGGGSGGASFATLDSLRVVSPDGDGVAFHDVKVVVVNVNATLAPFFWRDCAGILGYDAIAQFVNRIDFDGHLLTLSDPKTFAYAGTGTALPMQLAGHTPVVDITVDGQYQGGARLDVGSGSGLDLHTPFVRKHGLIAKARRSVSVTNAGIGGTFESKCVRMRSIAIGPYTVADPLVGLSTVEQGALASEDYAGNLGNAILDRFVITLDYERRQVWLEPGARFGERRNFSQVGADFVKVGDDVRAARVLAGSPAARAGLVEGDTLTAVDGAPASQADPDALDRKFEDGAPGSRIALTVTRHGKPRTLSVTLRELL